MTCLSNINMFFSYNISDNGNGDDEISHSRMIFQCAHYCKALKRYRITGSSLVFYPLILITIECTDLVPFPVFSTCGAASGRA